jgi:hypothetical protein
MTVVVGRILAVLMLLFGVVLMAIGLGFMLVACGCEMVADWLVDG